MNIPSTVWSPPVSIGQRLITSATVEEGREVPEKASNLLWWAILKGNKLLEASKFPLSDKLPLQEQELNYPLKISYYYSPQAKQEYT